MKNIILDGKARPISNIFCIGRNYASHAKELNNPLPEEPVVFLKPSSAVILEPQAIELPSFSRNVNHECEVVAYIKQEARHIAKSEALSIVGGFGLGLDLTARDVQNHLKNNGLPWTKAKGFYTSACLSHFVDARRIDPIQDQHFSLHVNGKLKQSGHTGAMMFDFASIIAFLSNTYGLQEGDLIFSGTPEGVGPIQPNDTLTMTWENANIRANFTVG